MKDFIKDILCNNILMVALITIFVILLFLIAFENVRKTLIGGAISVAISCGFTLSAKYGSFNSYAEFLLKDISYIIGDKGSLLALIHRNILVTLITLSNDCNFDLYEMFGYFDEILIYIDLSNDTEYDCYEINEEIKEVNPFNTIKNRIYLLKYCFSFRL